MPRDLTIEIDTIVESIAQRVKNLVLSRVPLQTPSSTMEVEQGLATLGRELADRVTEQAIGATLEHMEQMPTARAGADEATVPRNKPGTRSMGKKETPIRLLGGRQITVRTRYRVKDRRGRPGRRRAVGRRGRAGGGYYPHLVRLGILAGATPALLSEASRQVADGTSFEVAQTNLAARGLEMNIKVVSRLTYAFARLSLHLRQAQMLKKAVESSGLGSVAGKRVVASTDGGRLRVREPGRGRRRSKTRRRGFRALWREPKVLIIYTIDAEGKKERKTLPLIDATLGDADAVFALLVGYLKMLGAKDAELLVLLGDGARWI